MSLTDPTVLIYLIGTGLAGAVIGWLIGLSLGRSKRQKLIHALDLKDAELKNQAHLDVEREEALTTERLSTPFGQLANEQLQSHFGTFLKLARESLGSHHERAKRELRRLVELAGMVGHCDFVTQSHHATAEGAIRPDMVIHMPENRRVVVDVKTPLDAYLDATQAEDDTKRRLALERHAAKVAERIRELASKAYWAQFENSPDFVILFIPGDQFLSAALAERPDLLDSALRQHVIPSTPTSLVALLKAIAYGWQQAALAENAEEIRGLAIQLYDRLSNFGNHLKKMGEELSNSVKAYNQAVGSLERRVLPSARRFTELGVNPRQRLEPVKLVEETPRTPAPMEESEGPTSEELDELEAQ